MVKLSFSVFCAAAFAIGLAPCLARAQQVVGIVGAANAAPTGRAPGRSQRILKPGSDIYFKDRIVTKRGGSAQLAFLDRSTLSVSENSDLVIDEFVYRPGETGTMTAHLTKGVMRFVGGDISHDSGTTIKTPVVTIGIRGGIGTIGYVENAKDLQAIPGVPANFHGGAIVVNGYGTMTVRNASSETVIARPGFAVFVGGANEVIAAPVRLDMASAKAMMSALASQPGQRGGLSWKAAASVSAQVGVARFSTTSAMPRAPVVNALDFTSIFHVGNALARNRAQAQQAATLQAQVSIHAATANAAAPPFAGGPVTPAAMNPPPTATTVTPSTTAPSASGPVTPVVPISTMTTTGASIGTGRAPSMMPPTTSPTPMPTSTPAPTPMPTSTSAPTPTPTPTPTPPTSIHTAPTPHAPTIVITTPVGTVAIGNGNNGYHYGWGYYGNENNGPEHGHH